MAPYSRSCLSRQRCPTFRPVTPLKTCGSPVCARTAYVWSGTRVCSSTAAAASPRAKARPTSVASRAAARATISTTTFPRNSSVCGMRRPSIHTGRLTKEKRILLSSPAKPSLLHPFLSTLNSHTLDLMFI